MKTLVRPPLLKPGDTIAIVPTARAVSVDDVRDGIALAESWGLRVHLGEGMGRKAYQQAGSAEERAADLQSAINDQDVRAIWCARGGYGTIQLMEHLDLSPLDRDPKWVIGFSDVTVLHNALHQRGLCTLHAQMPHMIASKTKETRETLRAALFEGVVEVHYENQPSLGPPADYLDQRADNRIGSCEGVLVGGNLSLLYALRGTPYDLDPKGKILFIEDLDELLYHVDRMAMNLKLSGWFAGLAGLVVGGIVAMHDKDEDDPFGLSGEKIIERAIAGTGYPACFGFPAGHVRDNRALVLGQKTKLSVGPMGATLSFDVIDRPSAPACR